LFRWANSLGCLSWRHRDFRRHHEPARVQPPCLLLHATAKLPPPVHPRPQALGLPAQLSGICKHDGMRHVLQDIQLCSESGGFVAFVGLSGCGKSTLLRLLPPEGMPARLSPVAPACGRIFYAGRHGYAPRAFDRTVGPGASQHAARNRSLPMKLPFRTTVLALLLVQALPVAAQALDRQARVWAASCAACHGTDGRSPAGIPAIAGRDAQALYRALLEFKTGQRPAATVMHQHTKGYSDEELKRIAAFYAATPAK
jgi:cytochrome subunit of sulfide dehydrogenase